MLAKTVTAAMHPPDYGAIIARGSQSFARAARLLPGTIRADVLRLYAWCRACDDLIDGQDAGHDRQALTRPERQARLATLRQVTDAALAGETVADAPAMAMADLARRHAIAPRLPRDLLEGFALDVSGATYPRLPDTLRYCYHVAGAVGLMLAQVMGVRSDSQLGRDTLDRACDLGLAFQLTNIARDLVEDARAGHLYAPADLAARHGLELGAIAATPDAPQVLQLAQSLVRLAEPYYDSAYHGALRLPFRCAWAILAARLIYRDIGQAILRADTALPARATTTRLRKSLRILQAALQAGLQALYGVTGGRRFAPERGPALWQRPWYCP